MPAFTIGTALLGPVNGGAAGHDRELAAGLAATLTRIKRVAETAALPAGGRPVSGRR
jgi:hypothetical protein